MFLIVGLGNPGTKYAETRHNVGFDAIDYLAAQYNIKITKLKNKALIGDGIIQGNKVVLAKPQTFMNLSGESVYELSRYYKIKPENIIVIYDDINLPVGSIRIREKGSDGGHNGMKSIIYMINTIEFPRVRIGVGLPDNKDYDLADYVLSRFSKEEKQEIISAINTCPDAICTIMQAGAQIAASKFNNKR